MSRKRLMYSDLKNVQILISLLKEFGVSNIVLSPGGSDIPIIHSLQIDSFFKCYSVVDERSAAYYAMGLSQSLNSPVACVCTSGTAVCNFLPGITEAYYQNVPVIAITADKNQHYQGQLETQKIEQTTIFNGVVKKSVNLPVVHDSMDEWLCNRLINEALIATNHRGMGPVHINIPIVGNQNGYNSEKLPNERKINVVSYASGKEKWQSLKVELGTYKRIVVVIGQNLVFSDNCVVAMNKFFDIYKCVYAVEHLSNLHCNGCIYTYPISEILYGQVLDKIKPDLIISLGNNLSAYLLKEKFREFHKSSVHWLISETGEVRDEFKCLRTIFECTPEHFFEMMTTDIIAENDSFEYFNTWKKISEQIHIPEFPFSNMYIAQKLASIIPEKSILHTAVLNSTRTMQYCNLAQGVKTYSNVGALGIDGCFSTFMGQAAATDQLAFLLIGDLSFFYDMNAATIRSLSNNVRVILLNNYGGAEFHVYDHNVNQMDKYICAEHSHFAGEYVKSLGYKYFAAHNKEEFDSAIESFPMPSTCPLFIECFTDMHEDARIIRDFYDDVRNDFTTNRARMVAKAKSIGKMILSERQIGVAKKMIRKIKK